MATIIPYYGRMSFTQTATSGTNYGYVSNQNTHGIFTVNLCRRNYSSSTYEGTTGSISVDIAVAPYTGSKNFIDIEDKYWCVRGITLTGLNKHVEVSKIYVPQGSSIYIRPSASSGSSNVVAHISGVRENNSLVDQVGILTGTHSSGSISSRSLSPSFTTGSATANSAHRFYLFPKWENSTKISYGTATLTIYNEDPNDDAMVIVYLQRQKDDETTSVVDSSTIFVGKIPPKESVILENLLLTNLHTTGEMRSEISINCNKQVFASLNGIVVKAP